MRATPTGSPVTGAPGLSYRGPSPIAPIHDVATSLGGAVHVDPSTGLTMVNAHAIKPTAILGGVHMAPVSTVARAVHPSAQVTTNSRTGETIATIPANPAGNPHVATPSSSTAPLTPVAQENLQTKAPVPNPAAQAGQIGLATHTATRAAAQPSASGTAAAELGSQSSNATTPSPTSATPTPSPNPSPTPSATPSPTPSASPSPNPTPSPTPPSTQTPPPVATPQTNDLSGYLQAAETNKQNYENLQAQYAGKPIPPAVQEALNGYHQANLAIQSQLAEGGYNATSIESENASQVAGDIANLNGTQSSPTDLNSVLDMLNQLAQQQPPTPQSIQPFSYSATPIDYNQLMQEAQAQAQAQEAPAQLKIQQTLQQDESSAQNAIAENNANPKWQADISKLQTTEFSNEMKTNSEMEKRGIFNSSIAENALGDLRSSLQEAEGQVLSQQDFANQQTLDKLGLQKQDLTNQGILLDSQTGVKAEADFTQLAKLAQTQAFNDEKLAFTEWLDTAKLTQTQNDAVTKLWEAEQSQLTKISGDMGTILAKSATLNLQQQTLAMKQQGQNFNDWLKEQTLNFNEYVKQNQLNQTNQKISISQENATVNAAYKQAEEALNTTKAGVSALNDQRLSLASVMTMLKDQYDTNLRNNPKYASTSSGKTALAQLNAIANEILTVNQKIANTSGTAK